MQVIDFSKKYEILKGCGNHAEIFPRNIFCVIAGSTGCGKTNLIVNLLLQENKINYSDVYIYSPTLHQPAYIYFKHSYELMEKIIMNKTKHSVKIAHFCDPAEKQLIDPVELDKKQNHVMIFDDVMLDDQTATKKYFCSGRRVLSSTIFTQNSKTLYQRERKHFHSFQTGRQDFEILPRDSYIG